MILIKVAPSKIPREIFLCFNKADFALSELNHKFGDIIRYSSGNPPLGGEAHIKFSIVTTPVHRFNSSQCATQPQMQKSSGSGLCFRRRFFLDQISTLLP